MTTTRMDILGHVGEAFDSGPLSRDDLVTAAGESGASDGVLVQLRRLPDRCCRDVRELWPELRDIPVGA